MKSWYVVDPPGGVLPTAGNFDFARPVIVGCGSPSPGNCIVGPRVSLRVSQLASGRPGGPINGVVGVGPVIGRMVGGFFDIRIIWNEGPDTLPQLAPVAAQEGVATRLAIKEFEDARSASASSCWPVEQLAD